MHNDQHDEGGEGVKKVVESIYKSMEVAGGHWSAWAETYLGSTSVCQELTTLQFLDPSLQMGDSEPWPEELGQGLFPDLHGSLRCFRLVRSY